MKKDINAIFGAHHGLDEKSVKFLTSALDKSNLPGFDYLEFKQSLSTLAEMGIEGEMAYKSAFATASTMGLTLDKLVKTGMHYKKVLEGEKAQFDKAVEAQVRKKVGQKQAKVEQLRKKVEANKLAIEKKKEEILALEKEILAATEIVDSASADIEATKAKIVETGQNFEVTLNSLLNQIEEDLSQAKIFLG